MVSEVRYTSIKRVLDNLLDHPLLQNLTLDRVIRYTIRFIAIHGYPKLYQDKIEKIRIEDFRGLLPCDLIQIIQVKDAHSGICLRSMTDNFNPGLFPTTPSPHHPLHHHPHFHPQEHHKQDGYAWTPDCHHHLSTGEVHHGHHHHHCHHGELAFKTQGRVIFTSFPHGEVIISYKSIPVDENNYPMLVDNEVYLGALEAYIKKQEFTVKFETGKIAAGILQNAQSDYAVLSHELRNEFTTMSLSEMESMSRHYQSMIPRMREFDKGFRDLGNREYLINH